jgi:hypothetical protein
MGLKERMAFKEILDGGDHKERWVITVYKEQRALKEKLGSGVLKEKLGSGVLKEK